MSNRRIIHLTGIDDLRSAASAWDDLWWRSDVALPTARAELLAQWLEHFAPQAEFHAFAVEEDGRWLAALPLISSRLMKLLPIGTLPNNPWLPCGDLLLDPAADAVSVLDDIVSAAGRLSWQWLWLNETSIHSLRWREFLHACTRSGATYATHERYPVARIEITGNWDFFLKHLSRSHRQSTSKAIRRLNDHGNVNFIMHSGLQRNDVGPWLEKVFEVENRSWKGNSGSSVISTPGIFDFYLAQARQLADWGQLEIVSLELEGRAIASLFGFSAKGVYHAHKIGYDPQYAQFGPGQIMFWHLIERLHQDGQWQAIDCIGPLTEALSRWRPAAYTVGRIVVAPRRLAGRAAIFAYKNWWPAVRHLRETLAGKSPDINPLESPIPKPVGAQG